MSTVLELREKRAAAWDKAKAFLDEKRNAEGVLSAEDSAIYDKMEADVINFGKEINRAEKQAAIDTEMAQPTSAPIKNDPDASADGKGGGKSKKGRASDEYKRAFWNTMRGLPAIYDDLSVGVDTKGGYTVPDNFEAQLIEALEEEDLFRKIANVIRTSNGDTKIPVVAETGVAFWVDEGALIPESDVAFAQITLSAHKLATRIKISDELLQDSIFNLEQFIAREFARRIGVKEEESFLLGDGVGKPLGLLSDSGAQVDIESDARNSVSLDDIIDLFYSLRAPYRRNSVFVMNDSTVKGIRKLKDASGQYLWAPSIKEATPDTLLNRPLYTSSFMPKIAPSAKTVMFGDFRYYWIADRLGRQFKRLNELYAETGQVGFIGTQRVDARLVLPEAIKVLQQAGGTA